MGVKKGSICVQDKLTKPIIIASSLGFLNMKKLISSFRQTLNNQSLQTVLIGVLGTSYELLRRELT